MMDQVNFSNNQVFALNDALFESERKSEILKKYTRKSLVDIVSNGDDPSTVEAQQKDVAVLFSDIRWFTSLSEKLPPMDVVNFLNEYFDLMNAVIEENHGEIDKLIGDCIMAYFFDPVDAVDAVKAGISIRKQLARYNDSRISMNQSRIENGVGISYGTVIIGNIGSSHKLDFTLIGDTVNVASRLESLTKTSNTGILVTEKVLSFLDETFNSSYVDIVKVEGKEEALKIYEIT